MAHAQADGAGTEAPAIRGGRGQAHLEVAVRRPGSSTLLKTSASGLNARPAAECRRTGCIGKCP
ncbi:MAG: hypothetical protein AVDCRST_MAG08-351 [uncultured Acetobacteraceae bacterium]|uniref:Uncharacterized protein n=1 Tax=uncultured Acetobacteraceae bacterium TaxID=169975 RepID=A0A6J4H745_9PROT|nr:MAG: hypothetical protein AVDCRST_MAG08-351 [uncultured Acetobacteraceae bacterium]